MKMGMMIKIMEEREGWDSDEDINSDEDIDGDDYTDCD